MDASAFDTRPFTFDNQTRNVLISKTGTRPVLLLHEIYGISPPLLDFAGTLCAAGFKLYLPVLYGSTTPKDGALNKLARGFEFLCVAHQFRAFSANDSGPWNGWLRQLVSAACDECQSRGAGVIGLCLTGNFALSMACDPKVLAPVMAEPSLPLRPKDGLHLTPNELTQVKSRIENDGLEIRGYRFTTDTICPHARFEKLQTELGAAFKCTEIPAGEKLHSVFTYDLRDASGNPRHDKVQEVIAFLNAKLNSAAKPASS